MLKSIEKLTEIGWIDMMQNLVKDHHIDKKVMETSLEVVMLNDDFCDIWARDIHQLGLDFVWYLINKEYLINKDLENSTDDSTDQKDPEPAGDVEKHQNVKSVSKDSDPALYDKISKWLEELENITKDITDDLK